MSSNKKGAEVNLVAGVILSLAITAILCSIYALMIKAGKISADNSDVIISAAIAIGVFVGGVVTARGKGRKAVAGLSCGILCALALSAVPLIAYPTDVNWLKICGMALISAVSGFAGGSVAFVKSDKSFHKNRKKHP